MVSCYARGAVLTDDKYLISKMNNVMTGCYLGFIGTVFALPPAADV